MTRARACCFLIGLLWAGCGGSSAPSCPNDTISCPAMQPTYSAAVAPIIQNRCLSCHTPGGQQSSMPFNTYAQVFAARSPIYNQVYACRMPLAGSPPLSAEERAQLLEWLTCGAPNN